MTKLTTHVLDVYSGKPGKGIKVDLYYVVNNKKENHLEILNAHPDLVVEKQLTDDSRKEQNNASLNQCSDQEFKEFKKLNEEYKKKFRFPFIVAVKGKNRKEILNNFRQRITNNINLEFEEAKEQVKKIANFRLSEIIK